MRLLVFCGLLVAPLVLAKSAAGQAREPRGAASVDASSGHAARHRGGHHHRHSDHRHRHSHFWFDLGFPLYWGGGYTPAFGAYLPSYSYFGYSVVVPPPTIINVTPINAVAIQGAPAAMPANNSPAPADPALEPAKSKPKTTNAEHKARAGRFLGFGDAQFAKQKYLAAVERYKTAAEIAPDVAELYFRQGIAHVALGQYDSAARAFRRGLLVRSDWNGSPFRLDQLYDNAPLAKTHHLEDLARAVEANPFDSDLLLILGMQLFFDGQPDRSRVFLARSAQLGGNENRLLDNLLGKPKPGVAPDAQQSGGKISF
jgi:hypothetical protein